MFKMHFMQWAKTPAAANGRTQAGFTLLEALVALMVLSIGLLGLAALQARGMRYNHDAFIRSQATQLAYDLMERMRIQRYHLSGTAALDAMTAYTAAPAAGACSTADLNDATIATEVKCWHRNIEGALPGGTATVIRSDDGGTATDPNDDVFRIDISWTDRSSATPITQSWSFQP